MQNTIQYKIIIAVFILVLLIFGQKYKELSSENDYLNEKAKDYRWALSKANANIEEANSYIEDAQSHAWSNYEEMGQTLENLQTVDTVLISRIRF